MYVSMTEEEEEEDEDEDEDEDESFFPTEICLWTGFCSQQIHLPVWTKDEHCCCPKQTLGNLREIIIWRDIFTIIYFKMPRDKMTTLGGLPLR